MVAAMVPRGQQAQDLAVRHHKADFVVRVTIWGCGGSCGFTTISLQYLEDCLAQNKSSISMSEVKKCSLKKFPLFGLGAPDLAPEYRLAPTRSPCPQPLWGACYLIRNSSTFSSTCSKLDSSCPRSWLTLHSSSCSRA